MQRPSNRSYSLRGDRMTRAQSLAMDQHWDNYSISAESAVDFEQIFIDKEKVIVEIGSGMGEATAQIAHSTPQFGYLAVEMHKPGLAALLLLIIEKQLSNIKLIREDAIYLLDNFILDNSIDGIHLLFPDPWPKRKQHKRRLLQPSFIQILASKLKSGGRINIATDWYPYAQEIEKNFAANTDFTGGVIPRPQWRPLTKFESKGIIKEHVVTDFQYTRK